MGARGSRALLASPASLRSFLGGKIPGESLAMRNLGHVARFLRNRIGRLGQTST